MRITLCFDYDSPAGYRESFRMRDTDPWADYKGTEALLKVLADYSVPATFAVVGEAVLAGTIPVHCPEQVREIHAAGHEVASHSMHHKFIPPMSYSELMQDATDSRRVLEDCIGAPVTGFVPPFNRPMHFPRRFAPSVSEMLGLHRRGFGKQSIPSMLAALREAGFLWSRVSFSDKLHRTLELTGLARPHRPEQPFLESGVLAIPANVMGFGDAARTLVRALIHTDLLVTLCAHPNQAHCDNDENIDRLDSLLSELKPARESGLVTFQRMCDAVTRRAASEVVFR
ncbi:MAG: polysaccharide deacetylase family protein [Bryobacterales bacterium]|nr:polysaccharide deacetylase family protein [Bryobacterales bacterium]